MKKYGKLALVVAAVVLLGVNEASARPPRNVRGPAVGGPAVVNPRVNPTRNVTGPAVRVRQSNVNPATRLNANQVRQRLNRANVRNAAANQGLWNRRALAIRTNLRGRYNTLFTPAWYAQHPNAWRWRHPYANVWAAAVTWPVLANWVGVGTGTPYDYGAMYESDTYYITEDGEPVAAMTDETYSYPTPEDATELAATGYTDNPNDVTNSTEWMPLGVYAVAPANSTSMPYRVFQFALSKNGLVRGSYYDALTGQTAPIQGAVSKNTQQVAWTVGSKNGTVMETNLNGFTKDQTTVQIHQPGQDQTDQWMMVRLDGPSTQSTTNSQTGTQTNTQTGTQTGTQNGTYGIQSGTQTNPQTGGYNDNYSGTQTGTQSGTQTGTNQNTNTNTNTNTTNGTN